MSWLCVCCVKQMTEYEITGGLVMRRVVDRSVENQEAGGERKGEQNGEKVEN